MHCAGKTGRVGVYPGSSDPPTNGHLDIVRSVGGSAMIKGLRSQHDFEAEFQQGLMNRKLAPEIETICLLTNLPQVVVSSSLLKEVARLGGNVTDMLPPNVVLALQKKFGT